MAGSTRGAAVGYPGQRCPVAALVGAGAGIVRFHIRAVSAVHRIPVCWMHGSGAAQMAGSTRGAAVGYPGQRCPVAVLVGAGAGIIRFHIRAVSAVHRIPVCWVHGSGAAQMAGRTRGAAVGYPGQRCPVAVQVCTGAGIVHFHIRSVSAVHRIPVRWMH
jgi:hypothetical protein